MPILKGDIAKAQEFSQENFMIRCLLKQSMAGGVSAFCYTRAPFVQSTFVTHIRNQDSRIGVRHGFANEWA